MEDGIKPDIGVKPIVKHKRKPYIERCYVIIFSVGIYIGMRHYRSMIRYTSSSNKTTYNDSILYVSIKTGIKLK